MEGAVLQREAEEISLEGWPSTPLAPGKNTLVLEGQARSGALKENYSLKVREAGGNRAIVIRRVDFP